MNPSLLCPNVAARLWLANLVYGDRGGQNVKLVIMGNAGSGKTTLARRLAREGEVPILCLDSIAWEQGVTRKPLAESIALLNAFIGAHGEWIVEGCYGDLIEVALPHCDELIFLHPGVEVCVARSRNRPFEPNKFASPADQRVMLERLIDWIRDYEVREDEFGRQRHRRIYEGFTGRKFELNC